MFVVFFGVSSKPPKMTQTYALPRYNDKVTGSRFNTSDLEKIHPAIPSPHPTQWDGDPSDTDHFVANRNSLSVILGFNTMQYCTIFYLRLRTESDLGLLYVMRQLQFTAEHENKLVLKVRWRFFGIPFGINLELFWMPFGNPSPPGEAKRPQDVAQEPLFSN